MVVLVVAGIMAPACIFIALCMYYMVLWIRSRRGSSAGKDTLIGALGAFALLAPRLMGPESARYLGRALMWGALFIVYVALVFVGFTALS
ncbi:hypothetical protein CDN99_24590 [Roseateles aquatilis]|uniref:Uncharacterized protein n=1 Tax=Roseateles aquatilis TaxID=431061 RepID=A0A246IVB1_9BURK|nr:hypothetical protein CDN99_24590 [Roseateles aquatilis]